ncbi:MAG: hypothetical protein U0235_16605 [Polyangiaceae bacterium]
MSLPGFRASCVTLAVIYVLLAGSILARGPMVAMADYAVPAATLASPHYADAMRWVFLHMTVIGLVIGVVGWFAEGVRMQRAFAWLMLAAIVVYTTLDVRTADWPLGSALYKGRGSLGPVLVDVLAVVLWLRLVIVKPRAST